VARVRRLSDRRQPLAAEALAWASRCWRVELAAVASQDCRGRIIGAGQDC
jgi:hypothetical protein